MSTPTERRRRRPSGGHADVSASIPTALPPGAGYYSDAASRVLKFRAGSAEDLRSLGAIGRVRDSALPLQESLSVP